MERGTSCHPRQPWQRLALALGVAVLAHAAVSRGVRAEPASTQAAPGGAVPVYDVYVTSKRDLVSDVTTTREITREDMWQESARTLDEALVHEPSVIVRTGGEGSPRIDIRGLRTRQILTLIDGVPFYSTEDDAFDPSLIPTQIIDRVDVTYSNSSVLYGDGPIAGILQIRTRSGETGIHPEAAVDYRTGRQGLLQASVAGAGDGFEGFAAGRFYDAKGWVLPDSFRATTLEDGNLRENSDRRQSDLFGKVGYVVGNRARVDALVDYRHARYGAPWRVEQQTDFVGRARFERVDDLEGFTTQLSGQLEAGDRVSLRSWGFVTRQVEKRSGYDDQNLDSMLARNAFSLAGTTQISGGALHARIDGGAFGTLRLAANGRVEQFQSEGRIRDVSLGGGSFGFRDVDETSGLGAWSLGAEYEWRPVEPVGFVIGYAHAFLDGEHGVRDDDSLLLAGATVDLPTHTRLRASAARKLRFPSLQQLYAADRGNLDLRSERCWCFEVGVAQGIGSHTTLGVTGFWLKLMDFIELDDTTSLYENRQDLESRGFEVELVSNPWSPVVLRGAYTYLDAHDRSAGSPYDRLDNRPRHKLDAEVRYRLPTHTTLRLAMSWIADDLIYTRTAPIRSHHLNDFALFDARIEQDLAGDRLRIYLGIDNLTDQESEINVAFPQPGRSVHGGVDLRF